jgi:CRP-like cAMP-binding protein
VIEEVGAGKLVGWSWLFPPYIWHFDARATEPTSALFFYGTILREYCAKDPSLGFELFERMSQVMVERLQSARARLLSSHSNQGRARSSAKQRQ